MGIILRLPQSPATAAAPTGSGVEDEPDFAGQLGVVPVSEML